ncbi:MAG: ribonuclease III domain-containing protein [Oscillospiraceae bacterium]
MLFDADSKIDIHEQSPISLAFVGDGVFELLVRSRLVSTTRLVPNQLHSKAVSYVCARAQCEALALITPLLTENELAVVRRGKNSSKATVSKNATSEEYRASTAMEALFGYLYLENENARVLELFDYIWQYHENKTHSKDIK